MILYAVFFYVRYGVSYRDLEEIMAERGVEVGHATMNSWVVKFSPSIASNTQARKKPTAISWRMDETISRFGGNGRICSARLIVMAKPLILCCQSDATLPRREGFSNERLAQTVFRRPLSLFANKQLPGSVRQGTLCRAQSRIGIPIALTPTGSPFPTAG